MARLLLGAGQSAQTGGESVSDKEFHVRTGTARVLLFARREVNPDPARLDDPQRVVGRACLDQPQELPRPFEQTAVTRSWADFDDNDPGACLGRKAEDLPEITIKRDQNPVLTRRKVEDFFIRCACKP